MLAFVRTNLSNAKSVQRSPQIVAAAPQKIRAAPTLCDVNVFPNKPVEPRQTNASPPTININPIVKLVIKERNVTILSALILDEEIVMEVIRMVSHLRYTRHVSRTIFF